MFIFQQRRISCHCSRLRLRVSVTPWPCSIRVPSSGVNTDGTRKPNSPRRSIS